MISVQMWSPRVALLTVILPFTSACSGRSSGPLPGGRLVQFHIAVQATNPDAELVDEVKRALREGRPTRVDLQGAEWFPIANITWWIDGSDDLEALKENPSEFFARRYRIVITNEGDTYYQLLYTDPKRSMIYSPASPWSMESALRTVDQLGRPAVGFQFDLVGAGQMARLTGPHVGELLAIVINGEVYSSPTLQSQITNRGIITGNFTQDDAGQIIDLLRHGVPSSTQPAATPTN